MDTALHNLITNKAFETQQASLTTQFTANHIDYAYKYNEGAVPSLTAWLNHGNIPATITIAENGSLNLTYFENGRNNTQQFTHCTADDFFTMIDYVVNYLAHGNFDLHKDWHSGLKKA